MPLTLRASPSEGCIRSTDDHPGILVLRAGDQDGVSWGITASVDPTSIRAGRHLIGASQVAPPTIFPVDEVVDAAADAVTLALLHKMSLEAVQQLTRALLAGAEFDLALLVIEWGKDVHDAVGQAATTRFRDDFGGNAGERS